MKKLWIAMIAASLSLPGVALAQSQYPSQGGGQQGATGQEGSASHGKKAAVKGTISEDGKSIVSDTDGKSWTIANPDAVKGHEGHHVQIMGTADATTGQIEVASVKMLKAEKGSMKNNTPQ
jgi:hypothetical protein